MEYEELKIVEHKENIARAVNWKSLGPDKLQNF